MALTLGTAARNAACNGVVDLVDAGSGAGKLKIKDVSNNVLCIIALSDPAFGNAATGTATANGLPLSGVGSAAAGAGTDAAAYDVTDSDDNVIWSGTVPGNLALDNANIAEGQGVTVTSWSHSQPAS